MHEPGLGDVLSGVALLRDIPDAARARRCVAHRVHPWPSSLYGRRAPDGVFLLETGHVKMLVRAYSRAETLIDILGPGEFVGELAPIDEREYAARFIAMGPVAAIRLDRAGFLDCVLGHPPAGRRLLSILADRIRRLGELAADLAFLELEDRLAKTLLALAAGHGHPRDGAIEIDLLLTQDEPAAMAG
jgi:CRP-like cAMP-binding protein